MEKEYQELIKQYPFLETIVEQIHNIDRMDERNWDNMFQKDFTKCLRILKILKENKLL
jgi:hypothetical protein